MGAHDVLTVSFDLVILTGLFGIACYYTSRACLPELRSSLLIEDLDARREELEPVSRCYLLRA